jgi:hypothetical protein
VLKWIGGGDKVDHPMADAKRAREIVAELPASDPVKAIEEIIHWLDTLNATEGFRPERRFENVDLLDAAAKSHQRKLAQDYLSTPRQQKFHENRLWNGVFGFWKHLGDAYLTCIAQYEGGAGGGTAFRRSLPVIAARALRALTMQLKWTLIRYGPVEPRLWREIARVYQFAEAAGFAADPIAIYPGAHGGGSVRQEFLKAMMLSASSTDSLTPVRQEIAERAVAHFSGAFRLEAAPAAGCRYVFDLAQSRPPARGAQGAAAGPTLRYFGAGEGLARLERLLATLVETGALPSDVNLGGNYGKEVVIGVFRHLTQYWSDNAPARGSERRRTAARITVVPGLAEILAMLDPAGSDALDFSEQQSAESWIVENVSEGGYGAIIPAQKSDWIRVGGLIGVQGEMARHWGVGLIRRVTRDEHQQRRVGIQLLAKAAIPVRVAKSGSISSIGGAREPEPAVLLSTAPDKQGEIGIVMREGIYNNRDSLEMTVNGKGYLLMPSRLVEGGEDFDWARFRVMQRAG